MTHTITDLPPTSKRVKASRAFTYGIYAAGLILLADDLVKKVRTRKSKTDDND
jgi:hypothetical protein